MSSAVLTANGRRLAGWRLSAFDALRVLVGVLLLAAAVMKGYGLVLGVPGAGWTSNLWVQLLAFEAEAVFGVWALAGYAPQALRWSLVGYFLILAAAAASQGLAGSTSCGCLGPLAVSAWLMMAIDGCAVAALLAIRPRVGKRMTLFASANVVLAAVLLLALIFGIGSAAFGSPVALLARLTGEKVAVEPGVIDLGECAVLVKREARLNVANYSDEGVTVVGGSTTCRCMVTARLPVSVPAHELREVIVSVTPVAAEGEPFSEVVTLYLDGGRLRLLQARVNGRAVHRSNSHSE